MKKNGVKKESRKKIRIIAAGDRLFKNFGIRKITVEEICREAGASKMTFYKYFKNKNELVKHLWQRMLDENIEKLSKLDRKEIPFTEKIKKMLKMKEEATSQMGTEYIWDHLHLLPELQDFYSSMSGALLAKFLEIVRHAQEKGEVRRTMRPEFFLAVIQKMMELSQDEQLAAMYKDYTDFALEVNNFIYYGILPRPDGESG